jgi:hypothetical protein
VSIAFAIVGVVLLGLSIWAWRQNRAKVPDLPSPWMRLWTWRWVIGCAIGVAGFFIRYSADGGGDHYTVYGLPFFSYAFDQRGDDYVGVLTIPAVILNFVTGALLPQLLFWLYTKRRSRRNDGANA